jgi:hypothetical protein
MKLDENLIELRCSNKYEKFKRPCGKLLAKASGIEKGAVIKLYCRKCQKDSRIEFL